MEIIVFYQAFNNFFHQRFESIQYNTVLLITGAIRSTSKEKQYTSTHLVGGPGGPGGPVPCPFLIRSKFYPQILQPI